jgi:RNA polymerase primary sigma factor
MSDATTPRTYDETAAQDSLRRYLQEIGRYALLTRAEEVQLAKRVEAGDPVAVQRLVESNLRLVVTIAKTYRTGALELLDLVQEGTLGLMKAAERYDWRRGTKFSTYAAWWIRSAIVEALGASSHPIRLPDSVRERAAAVERTDRALTARLGRRPTTVEIAATLELTPAQVADARAVLQPVGSLDETVGADGETRHADLLVDPHATDPLQSLVDEASEGELASHLRTLPERSRYVLALRFGLAGGETHTADEVAARLGVARERVRQIELHALRKLAASAAGRRPAVALAA